MQSSPDEDPELGLNVLAPHGRQAVLALNAPVLGLYVPRGHSVARPATHTAPAGQGTPVAEMDWLVQSAPSAHRPLQAALDSWGASP